VRHLLVWDGKCLHRTAGDDGGRQGTAENSGKHRKTAEDGGGPRGTVGDDTMPSVLVLGSYLSSKFRKLLDGTTQCRPSWSFVLTCRASFGKDGTGRRNVVRPSPGPGRTDCPVANTAYGEIHVETVLNQGE